MQLYSRGRRIAEWVYGILTTIWISVVPCYFLSTDARWDKLHIYGTIAITALLVFSVIATDVVLGWKGH